MKRILFSIAVAVATATAMPALATSIDEAMAKPGRLAADIERDSRSRPEVVIPLLGLQPGSVVVDIFGGDGYYSELLAAVVGSEGEVVLQNNLAYKKYAAKGLARRFDGRAIDNVSLLVSEADDLQLGEGRFDAALIIMSYHDVYHIDEAGGWSAIDVDSFMRQIHAGLKPGGRFLIVDHAAAAGSGNRDSNVLHRIERSFAIEDIERFGFTLAATSDVLSNPADNHELSVFDPKVRGKTDRFVLVFEKNP